jgi:integrase
MGGYKVARFALDNGNIIHGITDDGLPLIEVNGFLFQHVNKTSNRYAHILVKLLNYLKDLNISYRDARIKDVEGFFNFLRRGKSKVIPMRCKITRDTEKQYRSVLKMFYLHLMDLEGMDVEILAPAKARTKNSFYYGQISTYLDSYKDPITKLSRKKGKSYRFKAKRTYRKWYSPDDIDALSSNFKTLRDKVIFLISVECGCRCEEILTLRYSDYNWEQVISLSISKTFVRDLVVPQYLDELIQKYILTDRAGVETKLQEPCEYLFLNTKGEDIGNNVQYRNYYQILKRCAERAGLPAEKVITHAGRSTKAAELFKLQRQGVPGVTDMYILETMGWSNMDSAKPYKKMLDIEEKMEIAKRTQVVRRRFT